MDLGSNYVIHRIGGKIREHRKLKQLKLRELAQVAGVSPAMLSKIENGRVIPTIPTLLELIRVLEIQPQDFFAEINHDHESSGYIIVRKENYVTYVKEESAVGFHYQSILENSLNGSHFQISIVQLDPDAHRPLVSTAAYEFLYLIQGELKYRLADETFDLRTGDSIFFDGNIPHVPINSGKGTAVYLVIYFFLKEGRAND